MIAGVRELAGDLELEIRRFAGDLAEAVEYVREYQGEPLPEGKKSVSFRVVAGAPDHTLTAGRNHGSAGQNHRGPEQPGLRMT